MSIPGSFRSYADRIERYNASLHAFLDLRLEDAEAEAAAAAARAKNGQLLSVIDGWCIGIKANIAVSGLPHHAGIGAYRDVIAQSDAEIVSRLKAAGAVILGTLNMHEGALGATTDNEAFGRTHNPWRHGFTPGGSSGGSGAAVSAALCDVALGSDTMGSVRIPSAYCGIQGHKPTTGLVSNDGVLALSHTLDHVGPHARRVTHLAATLGVLSEQSITLNETDVSSLKFGLWDGAGDVDLDHEVEAGFSAAIERIRESGGKTAPITPPVYDYGKSRRAGLLVSEVEGAAIHEKRLAADPDGFSPMFRKLLKWGAGRPTADIEAVYDHVAAVRRAAPAAFDDVDFILAPTAPQSAFSFDQDASANQADFTAWANFAALPATAVFTGLSGDGLPLSLQVIGPEGRDVETLSVAAALEAVFGAPPMPPGFT
ncbi:MAG: amidase [Pseudomonadota bacterium]